jgi:hypothetical protein
MSPCSISRIASVTGVSVVTETTVCVMTSAAFITPPPAGE